MAKCNIKTTREEVAFRELVKDAPQYDKTLILKALDFAVQNHGCQTRKTGEPYVIHPIGVAGILYKKYGEAQITASALLHDVVEDCEEIGVEHIYEKFGADIGFIVESLTKRLDGFCQYPKIKIEDRVERLLWAAKKNIRILLIKIADRENNIATINYLKYKKQVRMAFETQAIYQPLKRILEYDEGASIEQSARAFADYMKRHKLSSPKDIKRSLYNESFDNIEGMFGLVYGDTANIIWKISDFETFKRICETDSLNGVIKFLNVSGNDKWFNADFQFAEGAVIDDVKFGISSFQGI